MCCKLNNCRISNPQQGKVSTPVDCLGGVLVEAVISVPLVLLLIALVIGLGGFAREQVLLDQISAQLTNYAAKSSGLSFAPP